MNSLFTSFSPVPPNLPHIPANSPKKDYGKWQQHERMLPRFFGHFPRCSKKLNLGMWASASL